MLSQSQKLFVLDCIYIMVVKTISLNKQFKIIIIKFYYFPNTFDAKET